MKKLLTIAIFILGLSSISFGAEWFSGWKYITSLSYDFEGGKLVQVVVYAATTKAGTGSMMCVISDWDIYGKKDLSSIVSLLEKAKEDAQKVHIRNVNDSYLQANEYSKIDTEDN